MAKDLIGKDLGGCRILERIGEGAMGVVYKARQLSLDRVVALKVLHTRRPEDSTNIERFFREARAAAKLVHANIVQVYDVGTEGDTHYICCEYVDGQTVQEILDREGKIEPARGVEIVRQAAVGLARAQELGIVHRDIKPDNLMINKHNEVKVADFGLAKSIREGERDITHDGSILGTPFYMSPEQAQGGKVDGRSDIYSLGAALYHMITGFPPFDASTFMGVIMKHVSEPLIPAHVRERSVPRAISDLTSKMLAKDLSERYQSARDLLVAIAQVKQLLRSGRADLPKPKTRIMLSEPGLNKRQFKRISTEFIAEITEKTGPRQKLRAIVAKIKNLSQGGVFIETERLYPVDTLLEVNFSFSPSTPEITVLGVVRWTSTGPRGGMGVQFVRLPTRARKTVKALLTEREADEAMKTLTRSPLHRKLMRAYARGLGDSMGMEELAKRAGSSLPLVKEALKELEQYGLAQVQDDSVTFFPSEDARLRTAISSWALEEQKD